MTRLLMNLRNLFIKSKPIVNYVCRVNLYNHGFIKVKQKCSIHTGTIRCNSDTPNYQKELILGIETSCDDTGAAVVDSSGQVIGEALDSQHRIHLMHGGIIPPVAKRLHAKNIDRVVNEALSSAQIKPHDLTAVATTVKPGMPLSLTVGAEYGKELAIRNGIPFIPIHHMEAHALTVRMVEKVKFPFLVLLISGGHCLVVIARSVDSWELIGTTVDDAPGEAFDKVARRLKLRNMKEYSNTSGGQAIEDLALKGSKDAVQFPTPMWKYRECAFSFAGLKNSALRSIKELEVEQGIEGGMVLPNAADVCASFQYGIAKHLLRQTQRAMLYIDVRELLPKENQVLVVSGGVACNQYIRNAMQILCDAMEYRMFCPPPRLCTDNGIMIAWNGMERWKANAGVLYNKKDIQAVDIEPKCPLGVDLRDDVRTLGLKVKKWVKF